MERILLIHISIIHADCYHLGKKHIMGAKLLYLRDTAFNIDRALRKAGHFYFFSGKQMQIQFFTLIHIPATSDTAVISRICQFLCGQIDDKFSRLKKHRVRKTLFSHGNAYHRRIRTDRSCPCNCKNIGFSLFICHSHKHCRQRIKHVTRFKIYFSHYKIPSICRIWIVRDAAESRIANTSRGFVPLLFCTDFSSASI